MSDDDSIPCLLWSWELIGGLLMSYISRCNLVVDWPYLRVNRDVGEDE